MSVATTPIQELKEIYESIVEDKCVLVLGPNFYADAEKRTHQTRLLDFFNTEKVAYQHYYEEDELFLFEQPFERTKACRQIKHFYQAVKPNEQLRKIVEIPFHVYLTITPDKLLHKTFEGLDYSPPQIAYYKKDTEPQEIKEPTKKNPLVYNAFGILDNKESMILTHDDLYDYFKSIFKQGRSMPQELKTAFSEVEHIVFLGVPFRKWYMHLLLREFGAHEHKGIVRYAADHSTSETIRTFCDQQFKIHFIQNDINITECVDILHDKFKKKKALRNNSTPPEDERIKEMKDLVRKDKISKAIEMLKDYTADTDLENEVIKIEGRFNRYKQAKQNNTLEQAQLNVEHAKIVETILELIKQAS